MTIFELVKLVLDELYDEGSEEYGNKLDAEIKTRINYLKVSYKALNLGDGKTITYRDPATRCAYVYKYVAAHSDYVVQILEALRAKTNGNIFKGNTLRLSCVGGGPGSDVIGTLKYLAEYAEDEPVKKMICYLLDGEQAWSDTWTEIGESFPSKIAVNVNFQKLDVRDPESWSAQKKFLKADLFTFIYFVSEVYSLDDGTITAFWQKIFDEAVSGAIFIYLDNGHEVLIIILMINGRIEATLIVSYAGTRHRRPCAVLRNRQKLMSIGRNLYNILSSDQPSVTGYCGSVDGRSLQFCEPT